MPVKNLDDTCSNIPQFVDSLFDATVRDAAPIQTAITGGNLTYEFSTVDNQKILDRWLNAWRDIEEGQDRTLLAQCPQQDQRLLAFLRRYLSEHRMSMFVPRIQYVGPYQSGLTGSWSLSGLPVYSISEYRRLGLGDSESVKEFLRYLLCGAHFVVIDDPANLEGGNDSDDEDERPLEHFYSAFTRELGGDQCPAGANSHYAGAFNTTGVYYPNLGNAEAAQPGSPFTLAFLAGKTVNSKTADVYNTFFQLEGWPLTYTSWGLPNWKGRHSFDYQAHKKTLWNLSTYGACAYSEKRGTTIFLAPESWTDKAQVTEDTVMPPYLGAQEPQGWLKKPLIVTPG